MSQYYLCSGHMLNCAFNTNHNPPDQIYVMTPETFLTIEEFEELHKNEKEN